MLKEWRRLKHNKAYLFSFICLFALTLVFLKLCSLFLVYNETRTVGYVINDFILNSIPVQDISQQLFIMTWLGVSTGIIMCLKNPRKTMALFIAVIAVVLLRSLTLYLVPLVPPEGIIPLRDNFVESSFYGDNVLIRDLFFSGHIASMSVLFFLVDFKPIKYLLGILAMIVGFLLLVQHVHYTIDVIAAPFFAFFSVFLGVKGSDFIYRKVNSLKKTEAVVS